MTGTKTAIIHIDRPLFVSPSRSEPGPGLRRLGPGLPDLGLIRDRPIFNSSHRPCLSSGSDRGFFVSHQIKERVCFHYEMG